MTSALKDLSVICIDDHEDTLDVLRYILESRGALVRTATTAAEGLKLLRSVNAKVAIIDLALPDESGIWLLRRLRELERFGFHTTLTIVLSAYWTERDKTLALAAGARSVLSKPFDEKKLVESILNICGDRAA